jgi:crossover junction endodeoxyribonuclease RuvC
VKRLILGVDPGCLHTGYGIVEGRDRGEVRHVASGRIASSPRWPQSQRLCRIYDSLAELIRLHQPQVLALEEVFLATNVQSALNLGQVGGVVLLAAAHASLPVYQYTPLVVKKAVVGYGRASKDQVQLMVGHLLNREVKDQHEADALAVGLCHLFQMPWLKAS